MYSGSLHMRIFPFLGQSSREMSSERHLGHVSGVKEYSGSFQITLLRTEFSVLGLYALHVGLVGMLVIVMFRFAHKPYVLHCILYYLGMNMTEKSAVVTVRLSKRDLERVEALRVLEDVDRSTLIKEFIEDGLRRRVVDLYRKGKLTAGLGAEILSISLREFLEILEREGVSVNWDSEGIREYLKAKYGD